MSFVYANYLPLILLFIAAFVFISFKNTKKYFQWIYDHWFYKAKKRVLVSQYLYILGFALLVLALLDFRGPEKNISAKTSDLKTAILIDISASMLAEDVRPNRIGKAIMLAKHYVKNAVGQQISVMIFSDKATKLVPFTKDINLLEARIDGIKNFDMNRGGTGLSLALQEAIQYFKMDAKEVPMGNILIISDAEENDVEFSLKIPDTISVGFIGLGTAKGTTIPLRNSRGDSLGVKKYDGEVVITKLDEKNIKTLEEKVETFKYWIANTYSLPTRKVIEYFQQSHSAKLRESMSRVRPVYANKLLIPALILVLLSFLLKIGKSFYLPVSIFLFVSNLGYAQQQMQKPEIKKSKEILDLENRLREGNLSVEGRKYLAEKLLQAGAAKESSALYNESLSKKISKDNLIHHFNKASAELQSGDIKQGLKSNVDLLNYLEKNKQKDGDKLKKMVGQNILKALEQQAQQQNQKNQENSEENKDDQQSQGEGGQGDQQKKDQKEQSEGKGNKEEQDKKDQSEGKEQDKEDEKKDKGKEKEQKSQTVDREKLPALLKQLLSDDNKLQKKMIEADTKQVQRNQKDW